MADANTGMAARLKAAKTGNVIGQTRTIDPALVPAKKRINAYRTAAAQEKAQLARREELETELRGAMAIGNRNSSIRIETRLEKEFGIPRTIHIPPPVAAVVSESVLVAEEEPSKVVKSELIDPCAELFDPCTREPIPNGDIKLLEQRVRDIKSQRMKYIDGRNIFPVEVQTRLDLLLFILNNPNPPNESILNYTNSGQLYESYWDIVFSLGLLEQFPINNNFFMYNGKIETLVNIDDEGFINQPLAYLSSKKINEGSKSGASDITFVYKQKKQSTLLDECSAEPGTRVTDTCQKMDKKDSIKRKTRPMFYFCSSKYFKSDNTKGVDKFDIQNIYTAAKALDQEYDRQIILLVKDKGAVEEKLRKAIRKYISEEASHVFGLEDLLSSLTVLYNFVRSKHETQEPITIDILRTIMNFEHPERPILRLRLHQYLATYKICDAVRSFKTSGTEVSNKFLVGIVPRGGKTYIAGGIVDELQPNRVVVLLGAKSETLSQFKQDLFESFQNFSSYNCIDVIETTDMIIDPTKKYIFIMSIELYKQNDSSRKLLQELKGGGSNRADLFICDEAHLKTATARGERAFEAGTKAAVAAVVPELPDEEVDVSDKEESSQLQELDKQISKDTPVVYMTGTYVKPLTAFSIPDEHVVIWDYQDIQQAKTISTNEEYFQTNFGTLYERALQTCKQFGQTYEEIESQYKKFPELYLLTTQFTPDAKDAFLKQTASGFPTLNHLFEVRKDFVPETMSPSEWYTGFTNPQIVFLLLNYLVPPSKQLHSEEGDIPPISSVLKSIDFIAQRIGDRLRFFTKQFVSHSQLWFLPHMQGHPLYKRMCALAGAIFQVPWFRKYFHIVAVSSSIDWNKKGIVGAENNSVKIQSADGADSCGVFSWACPSKHQSVKQCLLDQEALARKKGKGLIILAQNMLHLGISLPCVDIVVLLDTGEKVDERIQKMYRALTESTDKKGGYIIDMNYFRTVTAIMNYQIASEKVRSKRKTIVREDIPNMFNKVLDIYSIDIDKPIFGTDIERARNESEIQKVSIPELEKVFGGKSRSDSILLEDAAGAMNQNITSVMEGEYKHSYDEFLEMLRDEEKRQQTIREEGRNVEQAVHEEESKEEQTDENQTEQYPNPKIFNEKLVKEEDRKKAYVEMFKTTLKLAAFGTETRDVQTLHDTLSEDENLRQTLYDVLIKRGIIQEDNERQELQKQFIIDVVILPGLQKMVDQGRNSSYSRMKETVDDEDKYPSEVQKVLKYIEQHLAPKEAERHKFGEVFTPMSLVHEMLDTLPEEVWNDKSLKWLDPANGMGNFPIAVFLRLFYGFRTKDGKFNGITDNGEGKFNPGLTKIISGEEARRKHIVKDMLYMVELNSKNLAISRTLFKKLAPGIEPNIIQMHRKEGFLADTDMNFPNGTVKSFDIVMGNPPFNKGTILRKQTRKVRTTIKELGLEDTKRESLWTKFVLKIFNNNIINPNGYLLFITPINWFHPETSGVREIYLSKQIEFIRIIFLEQSKKIFGGSGELTTAYYLIQNKDSTKSTQIIDILNNKDTIKLDSDSIIILAYNSIYHKVCAKSTLFMNTDSIKSTTVKKCSPGSNKQIIGIYNDGFIKYVKTSDKHPLESTPKIIINGYKYPRYYYDKTGEYGKYSKDGTNFIIIGDDLDKVKDYFDTKIAALLLNYIKFTQKKIDPKYYPDVRNLPIPKITDETLANYFGFTKEERAAINATEYPKVEYKLKEVTCAQLKGDKEEQEGGRRKFNKTRKIRR